RDFHVTGVQTCALPICIHPMLEDDFIFTVGGFFPQKEFKISVDGETANQEIDFDRDAAVVDSEATGALQFRWRFGEKWMLAGQRSEERRVGEEGGTALA